MSENIDTALVKGFEQGVTLLAQQEGSRLRAHVDVRSPGPGEEFSFDQVGIADPSEVTTRHSDTPIGDIPHDRRWVTPITYSRGEYIDKADMIRSLNDFTNPYTRGLGMGFGRQQDRAIIAAASATARTGKTSGTSTESFPGANQIAHGGVGLTLAKLNETAKILRAAEMPKPWAIAVSAEQIEDVMNDPTITSGDYNSVRLLNQGEIDTFAGFTWVQTELLTVATSVRTCLAWSKMGMLLAVAQEPTAAIDRIPEKNNSTLVQYQADFGATRMQQLAVVEIACSE